MEAVLHIEPILRKTPTPLLVGHNDYIFYGEKLTVDGENIGTPTSGLMLGCPLESVDCGSTMSHIPLVKTIEYIPDFNHDKGYVFSETIHYLKDRKYLIPFRSKLRTGPSQGMRFTHLPSLNMVRENLTGLPFKVYDPRSEIIEDILLRDQVFSKKENAPLQDWVTEELSTILSTKTTNQLSFDTAPISSMINRYIDQIHHTPSEFGAKNLKDILSIVSPETCFIPPQYISTEGIQRHLLEYKNNLAVHQTNFRSFGNIPVDRLDRIEYNPLEFQQVCELLDKIPLTDFNVDIIVTPDSDIVFYHEHLAIDRLQYAPGNEAAMYPTETILRDCFDGYTLNEILHKFLLYHKDITSEIENLLAYNSVKIKIMKTITDEAAILLYRADSNPKDPPLCGVYFDIALQSLAPMSIIREPVFN